MADLVTSAEIKSYLGIEHSDDDTLLGELAAYVSSAIRKHTSRAFAADTAIVEYIDGGTDNLIVAVPPINSITSIADHFDSDAVVTATDYTFDGDAGLIYLVPSNTLLVSPGTQWASGRRRWKVTYSGSSDTVPDDVKGAALTWIADLYSNREDYNSEKLGDHSVTRNQGMPSRVEMMLANYRIGSVI